MLSKENIESTVREAINEAETFLVEVKFTADNKIFVYVDAPQGITIDECVRISKFVESTYDRDEEDYELQVSSPGLDQPFKVAEQYQKNLGKEARVVLKDGTTWEGTITNVANDEVTIEWEETIKVPGQKKKETKQEIEKIKIDDIASAKAIISF